MVLEVVELDVVELDVVDGEDPDEGVFWYRLKTPLPPHISFEFPLHVYVQPVV